MLRSVVAALLAALVAGAPVSAIAGGPRATGAPGSSWNHSTHEAGSRRPVLADRPGAGFPPSQVPSHPRVRTPSHVTPDTHVRSDGSHADRRVHRRPDVVIVNSPVIVVSPPAQCWAPGYWIHEWVPQTAVTHAWVPAYVAPDGTWIEGRWHPQTVTTGYWQPVWVPDQWVC
jgi:hypothetical protein